MPSAGASASWGFSRTVIDHFEEILPWTCTPTVGEACREFSHIAREPKGLFITPDDRGRVSRLLGNRGERDIRVIPDGLFLAAARALAGQVGVHDIEGGSLYPPLRRIRKISLAIATRVAGTGRSLGLARRRRSANLRRSTASLSYDP